MPISPKDAAEFDQGKAGFHDDHDPHDIGQKQNETKEDLPNRPAGSYDRDKGSGTARHHAAIPL
jgi:hypothetical protein